MRPAASIPFLFLLILAPVGFGQQRVTISIVQGGSATTQIVKDLTTTEFGIVNAGDDFNPTLFLLRRSTPSNLSTFNMNVNAPTRWTSWRVYVSRSGTWPSGVTTEICYTNNAGLTTPARNVYNVVGETEGTWYFSGTGDISNIRLSIRVSGLAAANLSATTYTSTFTYRYQ